MKLHSFNKQFFSLVSVLILSYFFLFSCSAGTLAPLVERQSAIDKIDQAKSVDAEQYAPTEFGNSEEKFEEGDSLIDRDKENPNNTKAKVNYLDAITLAKMAYEKAIVPYLKALIAETKEIIDGTNPKNENIARAREKNNQARQRLTEKEYDDTKRLTLEAREILNVVDESVIEVPDIITDDRSDEPVKEKPIVVESVQEVLGGIIHVVVKGDTLWGISKEYLGKGILWPKVYKLNTNIIDDPDLIYPRQKILVK